MKNIRKFEENFQITVVTVLRNTNTEFTENCSKKLLENGFLLELLEKHNLLFRKNNIFENETGDNVYIYINSIRVDGKDIMDESILRKTQICMKLNNNYLSSKDIQEAFEIYDKIVELEKLTNTQDYDFIDNFEVNGTVWEDEGLFNYYNKVAEKGNEITISEILTDKDTFERLSSGNIFSWRY